MVKETPKQPPPLIRAPSYAPTEPKDPLIGKVLAERFRLDDVAGRGDWGVLYQGLDLRRSQPIAIKVMHRDLDRRLVVGRMKAAKAYTAVKHERLGRIRAARFTGFAWIATEWMGGVSLRRMLRRHGNLPPRRAIELLMHLCRAVRPLHAAGVTHGNLKPNNIFLVPTNRGDFLRLVDPGAASDHISADAVVSPKWCSPEQLDGDMSQSSDVFAIGMIAYRMLSGRAPFFGPTPELTRDVLRKCEPASLKGMVPGAPFKLLKAVNRCLSLEPRKRFPGVDSLLATLSECLPETEEVPHESSASSERSVIVVRRTVIGEHETPAVPGPSAALLRALAPDASLPPELADAAADAAIAQIMSLNGEASGPPTPPRKMADTGEVEPVRRQNTLPPPLPIDDSDPVIALQIEDDPPDLFDSIEMSPPPQDDDVEVDAEAFAPTWKRALGKVVRRVSGSGNRDS